LREKPPVSGCYDARGVASPEALWWAARFRRSEGKTAKKDFDVFGLPHAFGVSVMELLE
jgi:hypothetical protein